MRTSYEAVRKQSYQMLLLFPNDLPFLTLQKIKFQFEKALLSSKNLVIRVYESSGYLMSILLAKHLPMLKGLVASSINNKNYNEKHGDIFEYLISNLEDGFTLFQENFLYDWDKFYSNTPHGMLTVISTVIQILFGEENRSVDFIQSLQNSEIIQKQYYNLLVRIMKVLEKIMMFATKISAENVSISVFDNSLVKEKLIKEKSFILLFHFTSNFCFILYFN